MNELRLSSYFLFAMTLMLFAVSASAQTARPITEEQAVRMALAQNPDLQAALLDVKQAHQTVLVAEDRYAPVLQLDAGVTHSASPSLSSTGDVSSDSSADTFSLGQQISKTFPWGTSFSFRLEQTRSSVTSQVSTGSSQSITLGPGYGLLGRLTVAQPLLRGAGTDVGEAELRAARLSRTVAQHTRDNAASNLLKGVLGAYWELWYAGRGIAIERGALLLARKQLADARARIGAGADAPVDVLSFESRVAELDEAVLAAEIERKRRALELARLLGRVGGASSHWIAASSSVPALPAPPEPQHAIALALAESHELRQLNAQVDLAKDGVKSAGDSDRMRLDLEGYVQTEGLGNREVPPALEQFATFGAITAHLGLVFEAPLFSARRGATIAKAKYAVQSATERLRSARQKVETDLRLALLQERSANKRLALAQRTLLLRERQLAASRARFKLGDAIAIEVREAEESLRRARLRMTRTRVDAVVAQLGRTHLTGELLLRFRKVAEPPRRSPTAHALGMVRPLF